MIRRPGMFERPGRMMRRPMHGEEIREIRSRLGELRRRHMENTRDFERLEELLLILLAEGSAPGGYDYDGYDYDNGYYGGRDRGDNHYMGGMHHGDHHHMNGMDHGDHHHMNGMDQADETGMVYPQEDVPAMGQGHSRFYGFTGDPFGPLDDSEYQ